MSDKEFLIKYEKLLDRGYCNCNEMNCIDNNSPKKILNIAKMLQKENEELKSVINDIKHILNNQMDYREFVDIVNTIEEILERVNYEI